ncbi:unnamed protein product [Phytophthora fragariaefolia]|uniref:Unnamed protein product n=1 Tax=Phytophthora fragariaefolia TaxID=1490495 RepID=A0A9W6Y5K0_9STRA|nr:unnamed protein product [Phytophthora fragariaefolia]
MWAIAAAMVQDVHLPAPSSFDTYSPASAATAGRARKSQRTHVTSSAPRDVLDLRPRSPARNNCLSSDSAQIDDSMSSAYDDGNRNASDATAEIDRPPESSKGPDTSPSSDSEPHEVEPEIVLQNVSDTTAPEIAGPDTREAVEEKEEAENDGTDDEVLSALSRSRSSLRRRGSLAPDRGALPPIIDVDGDGNSPSGSSSGNSEGEGSGAGDVGSSPQDHVGGDPAVGDLAGTTLEADEIDDSPLFPTFVPRSQQLAGFRDRRSDLERPLNECSGMVISSDRSCLSPPPPDSYEDLITGATVDALMDTSPWSKLLNGEAPLIFIPVVSGRRLPPNFVQDYLELEERHLQPYRESTHFLPISEAMCSTDQALSTYYEQRRQRRSCAGAAWRRVLTRDVIPALRHRQCDLDILLDPFFLHFPKF